MSYSEAQETDRPSTFSLERVKTEPDVSSSDYKVKLEGGQGLRDVKPVVADLQRDSLPTTGGGASGMGVVENVYPDSSVNIKSPVQAQQDENKDQEGETMEDDSASNHNEKRMFCFRCHCMFFKQDVYKKHKEDCESSPGRDNKPSSTSSGPGYSFKNGYHQCDSCTFRSHHKETLVNHIKIHTGDGKVKCSICKHELDSYECLKRHKAIAHRVPESESESDESSGNDSEESQVASFQCDLCPMKTNNKGHYTAHVLVHENPNAITCQICTQPYASLSALKVHMKKAHKSNYNPAIAKNSSAGPKQRTIVSALMKKKEKLPPGVSSPKPASPKPAPQTSTKKQSPANKNVERAKVQSPPAKTASVPQKDTAVAKSVQAKVSSSGDREKRPSGEKKKKNEIEMYLQQNGDYLCMLCLYRTSSSKEFATHLATKDHKNLEAKSWFCEENEMQNCKACGFKTKYKYVFLGHLSTKKHGANTKSWYDNYQPPKIDEKKATKDAKKDSSEESESSSDEASDQPTPSAQFTPPASAPKAASNLKRKQMPIKENASPQVSTKRKASPEAQAEDTPDQKKSLQSPKADENPTKKIKYSPQAQNSEDTETDQQDQDPQGQINKKAAFLATDFSDFAQKPFACALCFFRTKSLDELHNHVQNHLTGGSEASGTPSVTPPSVAPPVYYGPPNQPIKVECPPQPDQFMPQPQYHQQQQFQSLPPGGLMAYQTNQPYMPPLTNRSMHPPSQYRPVDHGYQPPMQQYHRSPYDNQAFPEGSLQIDTQDLLDPGADYVKDVGNAEPFQCLYCRLRIRNFAGVVSHFNAQHYDIVHSKAMQAKMRSEAAMASHSQPQPDQSDVKLERL